MTLMEVLLAMLILSAAITTLMPQIRGAARMSRRARDLVSASQIASNFLQNLQLEDEIEEGSDDGPIEDFEGYRYETEIEKVKMEEAFGSEFFKEKNTGAKDMFLDGLYRVELKLLWESMGQEQEYEMHTLLFRENS